MPGRVELSPSTWQQPWPPPFNEHRSDMLARVASRIQNLGARRVRVAVDGRTAAGKTTLGHELAKVLADEERVVLRATLDDFKRPWSERHLYIAEVDPRALTDVIVDNSDFDQPRLIQV